MSNLNEIVISTPLRTAIGTFGGMLKDISASDLGATVAKKVLEDAHLDPGQVDQVIVGNVLQAGQGMNPGRQVALKAGLPNSVPGMTLNRVCGSGLQAIISAAQEIAMGGAQVILAGGIENMDLAPFLLPKARYGYRMGMPRAELLDEMVSDGLWDAFNNYHMGITAENIAERYHIRAISGQHRRWRAASSSSRLSQSRCRQRRRPSRLRTTSMCVQIPAWRSLPGYDPSLSPTARSRPVMPVASMMRPHS